MTRPLLEIADLIRTAGAAFIEQTTCGFVGGIPRCCWPWRAAALRHWAAISMSARAVPIGPRFPTTAAATVIPKCQIAARERWIAARRRELLPTRYLHVVFTLPRYLAPLVLHNKKVLYDLLFRSTAETLLEVARDPRHLGAEIGFFSVLHTLNQKLQLNPHS